MSLIDDNVIPGNHGKIFGTNAQEVVELNAIKESILELDGITNVIINNTIFPREFTVHTDKLVAIADIEKKVIEAGFHSIPKSAFEL
jgi:copper chaperone CopZ